MKIGNANIESLHRDVEGFLWKCVFHNVKDVLHFEKDICQRDLVDFSMLVLYDDFKIRREMILMTIGSRLQSARIGAGLTQEQAAERLKVSRQTISNWENDKTMPDVAYAKEISLVYGVGLDVLISESKQDQIPECSSIPIQTNSRKGKVLLLSYLILWTFCVLFFWVFGSGGGFAMFYAIFIYGLLFRVASAVIAFLFGLLDCWPVRRYFLVFLFGVGQMLLPYVTYSLANTITSGNINPLPWTDFIQGICIGAVCITLGSLVDWLTDFLSRRLQK